MNSKYKNPYKKNYKLKIIDKINRNGITYGKLEDAPFFTGSENLLADEIKINGEKPLFLSGNKNYFKVDENKDEIEIEINWKTRLLLMQENLGNALIRYFLTSNTNSEILNYKVGINSSYIDVNAKDFKFMTVKNIESLANYAVFSNLAIENFDDYLSIERLAKISYEGPALKRTGEIGMILISSVDKVNSAIRLTIVSGENAYKLARNSINTLENMKMYLNSDSIENVFSDVKKLKSTGLINAPKISADETSFQNKNDVKTKAEGNVQNCNSKKFENNEQGENELSSKENLKFEESKIDLEKFKFKPMPKKEFFVKSENSKEEIKNDEVKNYSQTQKILEREKISNPDENKVPSKIDLDKGKEKSPLFYQAVESFKRFATDVTGINYIYKVLNDVNLKELREISNYILKEDNFIQIYGLKNGNRSKVIILRSQNLNFDLKKIYKKLEDHFEFTGTGNMYTLDLECRESDMIRIMESFLIEIKRYAK
ncbi:MAG: alanyl-tRNS synthetase [Peptoniphilus sp.]|uniref:alanyl-tRNS synthetase n=1 Tax=Peptoniphilus sp. TaxID=1971214 RepID=UPI0025EF1149|nr:alanyl-tRNS synthetase [Peptoniphilus sp.]MCI5643958.1 alanyl-tRNS synthetase [Peptoniphilus sp.]